MLFGALLPEKNRALDCAFCCSPSCKKSCSRLCFLLLSFVQKIVLFGALLREKNRSLDCARCYSLFSFNIHFWYSVTTSTCSYSHIFQTFSSSVFEFSIELLEHLAGLSEAGLSDQASPLLRPLSSPTMKMRHRARLNSLRCTRGQCC